MIKTEYHADAIYPILPVRFNPIRHTPKILDQLSCDSETWLETVNAFSTEFHSFVGPEEQLKALCQKQSKKWVQGIQLCRKLFSNKRPCPA